MREEPRPFVRGVRVRDAGSTVSALVGLRVQCVRRQFLGSFANSMRRVLGCVCKKRQRDSRFQKELPNGVPVFGCEA
jgi:hypothetical protein